MNSGPVFVRVARASEIGEHRSRKVTVDGEEIALWRVAGTIYAINNTCAHQHISSLHQGILNGLSVTCPMHGWTYSLETGRALSGDGHVRTYRVKVEGNDVFVEKTATSW